MEDFSKQKIAWGNLCLRAQYSFVEDDYFVNNPANIIVPGDKYLLAVLNSIVADFYIRNLGVTRNGGYFEYKPMFIEQLPVPILSKIDKQHYVQLVETLLAARATKSETEAIERTIDNAVFRLYGLSVEEESYLIRNSDN